MEKSEKFGFNLPSSDTDDIADVNKISDNFRIVEEKIPSKKEFETELGTAPKIYSGNVLSVDMLGNFGYLLHKVTEGDELFNAKKGDIYINGHTFTLIDFDSAGTQVWSCLDYAETAFKPDSGNAQSGIAVAQAVEGKADKMELETALDNKVDKEDGKTLYRGMEVIFEGTIGENGIQEGATWGYISTDKNGNPFKLDEVYFYINSSVAFETAGDNIAIRFNNGMGSGGSYLFLSAVAAKSKVMQAYGKRIKENQWFNLYIPMSKSVDGVQMRGGYISNAVDYVENFRIGGIEQFPAGTQILFCGRRAD